MNVSMNYTFKKIGVKVMMIFLFITFISTISIGTISTNGIIRHDTEIEKYINLAKQADFDCVGRYAISEESQDYAAGILISPKWVLTASHFVQPNSVWNFGGKFYKTVNVVKHPDLQYDTLEAQWNGRDLALVELSEPVWHVKPATRYYGDAELGRTITKIGYGYIGNGTEQERANSRV